MPNYVVYPHDTIFPDTQTAYFVTAANADAAIASATSEYDLGGEFDVHLLDNVQSYDVDVNVASKTITPI